MVQRQPNTYVPGVLGLLGTPQGISGSDNKNLECLVFQLLVQASPDLLQQLFTNPDSATSKLNSAVGNAQGGAICPQLNKVDYSQFDQYPGAKAGAKGMA